MKVYKNQQPLGSLRRGKGSTEKLGSIKAKFMTVNISHCTYNIRCEDTQNKQEIACSGREN